MKAGFPRMAIVTFLDFTADFIALLHRRATMPKRTKRSTSTYMYIKILAMGFL